MQLKIEFYSKEEYAIQYENDDQCPFVSTYDNDLFVLCCYMVRILQNFGTHPVGKILAVLLEITTAETINKIMNHKYTFPDVFTLNQILITMHKGFHLSDTILQVISEKILTEYPQEVQYKGKGNKSFYLSNPPLAFKNKGFGIFGRNVNYFGFHSVFCLLYYFSKKHSGEETFIQSISRISSYSGSFKLSDQIPFADTLEFANMIMGKVKKEINNSYKN